jgi:hypothetical protein
MVLLAQPHDEVAGRRLLGLGLRSAARGQEEDGSRIATEVMTEDMESAGGVTEGGGGLMGRAALQEVGAEGLVLALFGGGGLEEEAADDA